MLSYLMAKYYDRMLNDAEEKCLKHWRKTLLHDLSGDVLELGVGTGANLKFYPRSLTHLVLTEPCKHMRKQLNVKLTDETHLPAVIENTSAESLPYPDQSFDYVISTFVLCTVKNPKSALAEIHRVLRPNGKLLFIEHVAAQNRPDRLKWQKRWEPIWKIFQGNCHLTRDTEKNILDAGFTFKKISRESIRGILPIARPGIWGIASR